MKKIQPITRLKGFRDILPEDWNWWNFVLTTVEETVLSAGFERISLPILEKNELFSRAVGEGTDIVIKEMYTFDVSKIGGSGRAKKEKMLVSLRPELTASIARAYIENGMHTLAKPVSLYSVGKCFRHESPQAGRYREFTQISVEVFGSADPTIDANIISVLWEMFDRLKITGLKLDINSIGCRECRPKIKKLLSEYFKRKQSKLCEDCKSRLKKNPYRILDCKNEKCQNIIASAPLIIDKICESCKNHFMSVLEYLDDMEVSYNLAPTLVRGLDYYNRTVFEISAGDERRQSSLGGGGRYDYLVEELGGIETPAVGFALGIDRIVEFLQVNNIKIPKAKSKIDVYGVHLGEEAKKMILKIVKDLRSLGISTGMAVGKNSIKAQLKAADKAGALFSVIIGQKEALSKTALIRDMRDGVQEEIEVDDLNKKIYQMVQERRKEEEEEYGKKIKAKMDK